MATNVERETIINFAEVDEDMTVYTCNRKLKNKLHRMGFEPRETDSSGGELYDVPREYMQFRQPRVMSEEQKAAGAERLRAAREEAGIGEYAEEDAKPKRKVKAKAKPKAVAKPRKAPRALEVVEDEDDEDEEDEETEEDEDEEEEVTVVKRRPSAKAKVGTQAKARRK